MRCKKFISMAVVAANTILTGGALASAALFVYFFYRHSWTRQDHFGSWWSMVVHYGAPALLAGLLLAALRLKPEPRIDLAIVGVALVLSVYAGEGVLYLIESPLRTSGLPVIETLRRSEDRGKLAVELARQFGVPIDPRNGLEVVADLRARGIDAVRAVIPGMQLHFRDPNEGRPGSAMAPVLALGGMANKLTVLCNESGQYVTYESDEHGFRNAKGLWRSAHMDIVALGDSFTQGYCAPAGTYFVDLVRQQYPATLNLGMTGTARWKSWRCSRSTCRRSSRLSCSGSISR